METLPASQEDLTIEATQSEQVFEDIRNDPVIPSFEAQEILEEFEQNLSENPVFAAPLSASPASVSFKDHNLYKVKFSGSEKYVLFPSDQGDSLYVDNGFLVNLSSGNITGLVLDSSRASRLDQYHSEYITLVPFSSSSGNSTIYRYGASSYLTSYSPGLNNNLNSSITYGLVEVLEKPPVFWDYKGPAVLICLLLALLVILQFIGGLMRK